MRGKLKLCKKMKVEEVVHASMEEKPAAGPSMRMGSEDAINLEETVAPVNLTKPWITYDQQALTLLDKALIVNGDELTDKHINFTQALLNLQYDISGLWSSLLLSTMSSPVTTPALQIMHCRGNHWLVVTTICCTAGAVKVMITFIPLWIRQHMISLSNYLQLTNP